MCLDSSHCKYSVFVFFSRMFDHRKVSFVFLGICWFGYKIKLFDYFLSAFYHIAFRSYTCLSTFLWHRKIFFLHVEIFVQLHRRRQCVVFDRWNLELNWRYFFLQYLLGISNIYLLLSLRWTDSVIERTMLFFLIDLSLSNSAVDKVCRLQFVYKWVNLRISLTVQCYSSM